jgi:hypothetical protein
MSLLDGHDLYQWARSEAYRHEDLWFGSMKSLSSAIRNKYTPQCPHGVEKNLRELIFMKRWTEISTLAALGKNSSHINTCSRVLNLQLLAQYIHSRSSESRADVVYLVLLNFNACQLSVILSRFLCVHMFKYICTLFLTAHITTLPYFVCI